jgi:hypothetical protein
VGIRGRTRLYLPSDITFEPDAIEESVKTVLEKARTEEEREEGRLLLHRAFEKTGQLAEAEEFL